MSIRIFEHMFRRKLLLILPIILGGILGVLWAYSTYDPFYQSRATLWADEPAEFTGAGVSLTDFSQYVSPAGNTVNSMRELMGTTAFVSAVAKRADGVAGNVDRYIEIRKRTFFGQYGDHVFFVSSISDDSNDAARVAQAVVDEYSAIFAKQLKEQTAMAATFYKEQADLAKAAYESATAELNAFLRARPQLVAAANAANANGARTGAIAVSDPELTKLLISQQSAEDQYDRMHSRYSASQIITTSANAGSAFFSVVDPPEVPNFQVVPRKRTLLVKPVSGAMLGAMAAVGVFLLSWRLDRKVRFATDLGFVGNVVVVSLPALKARQRRWPASFVRTAAAIQGGIRDLSTRPRLDVDGVGVESRS